MSARTGKSERLKARKLLFKRYAGICALCGAPMSHPGSVYGRATMGQFPTLDHIHPKALGGSNDLSNLRLVHQGCNVIRGVENIVGVPLVTA